MNTTGLPRPNPSPVPNVATLSPGHGTARNMMTLMLVVGAFGALIGLGRGNLAGPSDWSPDGLGSWAAGRDPVTTAMAVLRLGALGVAGQVLVAGFIGAVGGALHLAPLLRLADLVTLPGMRGLVGHIAGIGLSVSSLFVPAIGRGVVVAPVAAGVSTVAAPAASGRPLPVVARRLADAPVANGGSRAKHTATLVRLADADPSPDAGSATMVRVGPDPTLAPAEAPTPPSTAPTPTPGAGADATSWLVRPGDHLWSISEATLTRAGSRTPGEGEVDQYWRKVVRANARLADPDLIFPGQRVILPPVPPR